MRVPIVGAFHNEAESGVVVSLHRGVLSLAIERSVSINKEAAYKNLNSSTFSLGSWRSSRHILEQSRLRLRRWRQD